MKERERNPGIGNRRPLLQLWSQERNPAQTALPPLQILGEKAGNRLDIDDESVSL